MSIGRTGRIWSAVLNMRSGGCGCGGGCCDEPKAALPAQILRPSSQRFSVTTRGLTTVFAARCGSGRPSPTFSPADFEEPTYLASPYYSELWQAFTQPSSQTHEFPGIPPAREPTPACVALMQQCENLRARAYSACLESNRLSAIESIYYQQQCVIDTQNTNSRALPPGESPCSAIREAIRNNRAQAQALLEAQSLERDSGRYWAISEALRDLGRQLEALDQLMNRCVAGGPDGAEAECTQRTYNWYSAMQRRRSFHHTVTEQLRGEAEELRVRLVGCGLGSCLSQDSYPYVNHTMTPSSHPCPRL